MPVPLEYAAPSARTNREVLRRRLLVAADAVAVVLVLSQVAFLLAMMSINIWESGVPPYGKGSSYNDNALGNADFVRNHPDAAAAIAAIDDHTLEATVALPALLLNLVTAGLAPWALAGYLAYRGYVMRRARRVLLWSAGAILSLALPFIPAAIDVCLD